MLLDFEIGINVFKRTVINPIFECMGPNGVVVKDITVYSYPYNMA